MKTRLAGWIGLFLLATLTGYASAAAPEYPKQGPDIYDTQADGAAEIAAALRVAQSEGKQVLLKLGANWCPWCRKLDHLMHADARVAAYLAAHYVVVLVDVNTRHGTKRNAEINTRYGNPMQHGLPVLLVLDGEGKLLTTQETGALEEGDHHDPQKVLSFLQTWAEPKA